MRGVIIALLTTSIVVASISLPAYAQKAKAQKAFDNGVAFMDNHNYKDAVNSFEIAYEASPHWAVLKHMANCYTKLNQPVLAIEKYEQFLKEGGGNISEEERLNAVRKLANQQKKVGALHLLVKPKSAEVRIDGEDIGSPPFDEMLLRAGPHHIIVIRGDKEDETELIIKAGTEKTLRFYPENDSITAVVSTSSNKSNTEPLPPAKKEATLESSPTQEPSEGTFDIVAENRDLNTSKIPFFIALGAAGVGVIGGIIGFSMYGYNKGYEADYAAAAATVNENDEFSWDNDCQSASVSSRETQYFCTVESDRLDFEKKMKAGMGLGITGTVITVLGGTAAALFHFRPEWFFGDDTNSTIAIAPIATNDRAVILFSGSF